jgi:hypothetical protein
VKRHTRLPSLRSLADRRANRGSYERINVWLEGTGHSIVDSIFVNGRLDLPAGVTASGNCTVRTSGAEIGTGQTPAFVNPSGGGSFEEADFTLKPGTTCVGSPITSARMLLEM